MIALLEPCPPRPASFALMAAPEPSVLPTGSGVNFAVEASTFDCLEEERESAYPLGKEYILPEPALNIDSIPSLSLGIPRSRVIVTLSSVGKSSGPSLYLGITLTQTM